MTVMSAIPRRRYTLEEYIELDKNSEGRLEYFDGEVVDMAGGSLNHNRITRNIIRSLENKLEGGGCEALPADMRVKVPKAFPYRYPDLTVVCGEPIIEEIQGQEMLVNPVLIVEVLSPSTEAYDRGRKFSAYQSIASFQEYLLVAQDRPHVTRYLRQPDGQWLRSEVEGLDGVVRLASLEVMLPLSEVYLSVDFPASESGILPVIPDEGGR
jgi:Uma2 family endonuclease